MDNNITTILLSILFIIIISCIVIHFIRKNNKSKLENNIIEYFIDTNREVTESIILPLINKNDLSGPLNESSSLDIYVELSKDVLTNQFYDHILKNNSTFTTDVSNSINRDICKKIVDKFFTESRNYHVLTKLFMDKIFANIKYAEKAEFEYVEYLKEFGEEPEGEPELHPIDNVDSETPNYDDKVVSINDLHKMGVTEDI